MNTDQKSNLSLIMSTVAILLAEPVRTQLNKIVEAAKDLKTYVVEQLQGSNKEVQ